MGRPHRRPRGEIKDRPAGRSAGGVILAFLVAGLAPAGGASAQEAGCALVASAAGPARQILRCPAGPTIEAEDQAEVHVQDPSGKGRPASATVGSGAVLIEVPPGYPGGFQILAPRAVASVRGTTWAVDVQPAQTSVFVLRGVVQVRRTSGGAEVDLRKGQGVDVGDETIPLRVTRWKPVRVTALLARFGRR